MRHSDSTYAERFVYFVEQQSLEDLRRSEQSTVDARARAIRSAFLAANCPRSYDALRASSASDSESLAWRYCRS